MRNNEDNFFEKYEKNKKQGSFDYFPVVWSLTVILISILISVGILFAANMPSIPFMANLSGAIKSKFGNANVDISNALGLIGGRQNILLLGVDSNGNRDGDHFKGARSDTIIVLNIDPMSKTVNAVSIPRDSKVYISDGHGLDKINAAHAIGGADLTVKTVERTFGIKISHYIAIDYSGVKEVVKALGGVPVYVEKNMHYTDRSGGLYINLQKGLQTLDPVQAEGYLRFRHDAIGDIGRMKRQQWFVKGVVKKMQSPDVVLKIPQIMELASKYIKTDMNFYQLSQIATFAKFANLDDVQSSTLPGRPSRYGHISYWILETEEVQDIIDRLIYREKPPAKGEPITVSIMYNPSMADQVAPIKEAMEQSGYKVMCEGRTKDPHTQILAHTKYVGIDDARAIKTKIPVIKSAQFVLSPNNYPCADTDLTMVVAVTK